MSQPSTHHETEAQRLLQDWLNSLHKATRVIDHETTTKEDNRIAQQQLSVKQGYLIQLIAAGLASGKVPF